MNAERRAHVFEVVRTHLGYAELGDLGVFIAGAVAEGVEAALAWQPLAPDAHIGIACESEKGAE